MTLEEAIAKARRSIVAVIERRLELDEIFVRDYGATDEEAEAFVAHQRREYETFLEAELTELRAWLQRDGETLQ